MYLFFDEIQEVVSWEKCINSFLVELDCDIYITSSNAKLLSENLSAYLADKYVEFEIYPLSFGEFRELYQKIKPEVSESDCFEMYLLAGGMPYLNNLRYENEHIRQYLKVLFRSIILKDVVKQNKIQNVELLEKILGYTIKYIGYRNYITFSTDSLVAYCKHQKLTESEDTVLEYLQ